MIISIDPQWIESLNTLMDDNKVLTLANNERIALKPGMRLLFEISHLRTATPATGKLYDLFKLLFIIMIFCPIKSIFNLNGAH